MIDKPPYGSPCNNCGLCCKNEICPLGAIVFPQAFAPCPALEQDGERLVCGLIAHPETYRPIRTAVHGVDAMREAALYGIGAGVGCDARLENERDDAPPEFIKALRSVFSRSKRNATLRLWQ